MRRLDEKAIVEASKAHTSRHFSGLDGRCHDTLRSPRRHTSPTNSHENHLAIFNITQLDTRKLKDRRKKASRNNVYNKLKNIYIYIVIYTYVPRFYLFCSKGLSSLVRYTSAAQRCSSRYTAWVQSTASATPAEPAKSSAKEHGTSCGTEPTSHSLIET